MGENNLLIVGVKRFAFTLFGVLSYASLLALSMPDIVGAEGLPSPLSGILRALAVPAYVAWIAPIILGHMIFGSHEAVACWFAVIAYPLRLLPFLLVDAFRYAFR